MGEASLRQLDGQLGRVRSQPPQACWIPRGSLPATTPAFCRLLTHAYWACRPRAAHLDAKLRLVGTPSSAAMVAEISKKFSVSHLFTTKGESVWPDSWACRPPCGPTSKPAITSKDRAWPERATLATNEAVNCASRLVGSKPRARVRMGGGLRKGGCSRRGRLVRSMACNVRQWRLLAADPSCFRPRPPPALAGRSHSQQR